MPNAITLKWKRKNKQKKNMEVARIIYVEQLYEIAKII